jgi:hypothetical protein
MTNSTRVAILDKLFKEDEGFLVHGIACKQWNEERIEMLKAFINDKKLTDENIQQALINLASEMAKKK